MRYGLNTEDENILSYALSDGPTMVYFFSSLLLLYYIWIDLSVKSIPKLKLNIFLIIQNALEDYLVKFINVKRQQNRIANEKKNARKIVEFMLERLLFKLRANRQ